MSLFQQLCESMQEAEKRQYAFFDAARRMSFHFAESLREHIDAPREWATPTDAEKPDPKTGPYITPIPVDEHWNEVQREGHPFASMYINKDKFFLFHLMVMLERGEKIFPKSVYKFKCGVRPQANDSCLLFVAHAHGGDQQIKEFPCDKDSGFIEPAKYVVQLLRQLLEADIFA